ncbi:MAG: caspase family protein [Pseudomonadota bacterium]
MKASALPLGQVRDEIHALARHGRVLVLIDACRAGAAADGAGFALDARSARAMLAGANVSVLTATEAEERAVKDEPRQNGAFTEALLEALARADSNHDGLISVSDLWSHVRDRLPAFSDGRQHPSQELRFEGDILLATSAS